MYELSKALVEQGNDVQVITLRRGFHDKKYQEIDGIKVYRAYYPRLRVLGFFIYLLYVWPRLKRSIKKGELDIIVFLVKHDIEGLLGHAIYNIEENLLFIYNFHGNKFKILRNAIFKKKERKI